MGADPFASRGADSCPAWREVVCAALVDIAVDGEIALGGGFGMAGVGCGSRRSDAAWALVAVLFPAVLGTPELGALAGGGGGWVVVAVVHAAGRRGRWELGVGLRGWELVGERLGDGSIVSCNYLLGVSVSFSSRMLNSRHKF